MSTENLGVHDGLQLLDALNNRLYKKLQSRKEDIAFTGLLYSRKKGKVKQKKVVVTSKALYFLQQCTWICNRTGITFGQKFPIAEFKEMTLDAKRLCLVIHTSMKHDDIMIQMEDLSIQEFASKDYFKLAEDIEATPDTAGGPPQMAFHATLIERIRSAVNRAQILQEV